MITPAQRRIQGMRSLLACAVLLLLTACGGDEQAASGPPLEGTPWVLASGLDVPGWEVNAPSAHFEGGTMAGSNGCNRYSASFKLSGDDQITLGPAVSTKIACAGSSGQVEQAFTAALARTERWHIDGNELVLADGDGKERLRFTVADLGGTWTVTAFLHEDAVSSPIAGTELTITFASDGTLSGSGGCNRYTGKWSTPLTITDLAATERACATPAGVMEQEQQYLAALPKAAGFNVDGKTLTLLTAAGTIVATYTLAG